MIKSTPFGKTILSICTLSLFLMNLSCSESPFGRTTKISDVLAFPSQYADNVVQVKGKVTESVIFLGRGYFMIADGTGVIAVIPSKTYPKTGENVAIRGQVKNAFVLGDKSLTVIVENSQK